MFDRDTAYKVWISQVTSGIFTSTVNAADGSIRSQVQIGPMSVSRVNLIATVTDTYVDSERRFASVTIDDGSAAIRAKSFKEDIDKITALAKGDLVMVVGKVREYQNEVYILPEVVKKLDNLSWALVRKLELAKLYKKEQINKPREPAAQIITSANPKFKILHLIREQTTDTGVPIQTIIQQGTYPLDQARKWIEELMNEGEIYENKPNHYKII